MQCDCADSWVQRFVTDWRKGSMVYSYLFAHNDWSEKRCNMNIIVKSQS